MADRALGVQRGLAIELFSVGWMIVEAAVAITAGVAAHSLLLVAFGLDSVIELVAGGALLWRLWAEMKGAGEADVRRREKTASWVVGVGLLLLAAYIVAAAAGELWGRGGAAASPVGIGLAAVAAGLMFYLAAAKKRVGREIGSPALAADGSCSMVCGYMSLVLLAGVALTALLGWWWVDAAASLALVYFVLREGLEAIGAARDAADT